CGSTAATRKPLIVSYVQQSEDPKAALIRSLGVRAYACNPLMIGNRLLGTLSFGSRDRDIFGEDELEFLRIISHYVSLAKEKQEMLQKAHMAANALHEANLRKDEFLANMSHEIRTPMNAVIGLANILHASKPLTSKQQQYISTLQLSANSLLALINDLLDIAKIESNNVQLENEPFNLRELVEEVASIASVQAYEKGIRLNGHYAENLRQEFLGDANRLRQVLINLVTNAIKFTDRGQVSISVKAVQENEGKSTIDIEVMDTGIGIPEDKLGNIFSKFSQGDSSITRKYGGTGLGLAITKALVDRMEGQITVHSNPGGGSRFVVSLPLTHGTRPAPEALTPASASSRARPARPNAPFILLVEDYKPNLLVACTLLEELGYRYETAANGREAIYKSSITDFDVVLMDVQMPDVDGYTATRIIRQREQDSGKRALPIIGVTAYALSGDKEKCLAAGMDDYLSKPFEARELEQKIAQYLQRRVA
ncbi:MAG: response regulator, partial [Proteobacteria bacterium]|nr:response regulator [Pseudomonadota bacterium]